MYMVLIQMQSKLLSLKAKSAKKKKNENLLYFYCIRIQIKLLVLNAILAYIYHILFLLYDDSFQFQKSVHKVHQTFVRYP